MMNSRGCGEFGENSYDYSGEDVVITGISGRFPDANNVQELKDNLFNKKCSIVNADDRWPRDLTDCPNNSLALLKDLTKFDADFFSMASSSTNGVDPQMRIMLEVCYEAIVDSGHSINELEGRNIGVFIGLSDPDLAAIEACNQGIMGTKQAAGYIAAMAANRISHKFGFKGPSFTLDTACSSSGVCFDDAVRRMRDGSIEGAIIGGTNVCVDPRCNAVYRDIGILSETGEIRPFDEKSNGMVRGEAVTAIFLQKMKHSRRIYAKVVNIECTAAGHVPEGIFVPSFEAESSLFRKTYETINMDPLKIEYLEAHGTGTRVGDPTEARAVAEVFCKGRKTPLLLGAMKSNIGHPEAASALCAVAKVIIAFECGVIPPSINYEVPNPNCQSIVEGKIKVITEPTPFDSPFAAFNNFGFGGVNVHCILERNRIERSSKEEETTKSIPKIVVYAATTEKALEDMFNCFHRNPMATEFFALFSKSAYTSTLLAPHRGFTILQDDSPPITSIQHVLPVKRQVWYIFTGMGCQWPGMGLDLMQIDTFAQSMRKSAKVLAPFGIDLLELLSPNADSLQQERHILPAFVTIAAIQIALVDVLTALGLEPDGIIGHSTGEVVSAYADGCCTAEEAILSSYYRGASVEDANLPEGAMAAVGLTWDEAKRRCDEGVYAACNNAEDSVTISGSKAAVEKFVEELKSENIFARIVNAYGYAFHCQTVSPVSGVLKSSLQKVYTNPKSRTKRWLSTAYRQDEWDTPECKIIDASYFAHNLISEVHFQEALTFIPADAIVIEIAPHCLLQSILKRSIGNKADYIGLMKKQENNLNYLLSSFGKLYNLGLDPQVENLYPPVSYPVPRGTPMIAPFIQWDHSKSYYVPQRKELNSGSSSFKVNCASSEGFLLDHCIEGRSLYPATGYLYLAWKALSDNLNKPMDALPVFIENFKIRRATILSSRDEKTFEVGILNISGDFEISEGGSVVATGRISHPTKPMFGEIGNEYQQERVSRKCTNIIPGRDMYNELKIHGYEYGPAFQGLLEINMEGTEGLVRWNKDWISYLDSLLLFFGIIYENSDFKLPTGALSIKIDPRVHGEYISLITEKRLKGVPVKYDKDVRKCTTPGVEIRNLLLEPAPHRSITEIVPVLEEYSFLPYCQNDALHPEDSKICRDYIRACCRIISGIMKTSSRKEQMLKILDGISLENNIEKFLKFPEENYVLLSTIQDVVQVSYHKKADSKMGEMIGNLAEIIGKDMLFSSFLNERTLRSLFDVAVENCFGKMNIIEWCDAGPSILPSVQDLVKFFSQRKTSYTLIHSQTTSVDSKVFSARDILVKQANKGGVIPFNFRESGDLVLTSFLLGSSDSLKSHIRKTSSLTKERGFILFIHKHKLSPPESILHLLSDKEELSVQSESEIEKKFVEENLTLVSKKSSGSIGISVYLLRKVHHQVPSSELSTVSVLHGKYDQWLTELKTAMNAAQNTNDIHAVWLVAQDTAENGIIGMMNCLKQEPGGDKIRCLFTDSSAPSFDVKDPFFKEMLNKDLLMNVYKNDQWGSFRHTSISGTETKAFTDMAYIVCGKLGDLSSFNWVESSIKHIRLLHPQKKLYHVYYSSLNFRDVMLATGKLTLGAISDGGLKSNDSVLGMEFSGRDESGVRVMGMTTGGALSNMVLVDPAMVCEVPDHWSLEEAATVPVVYYTNYYALIKRGKLSRGEKVLIHSGTGGIGQAAIRIALSLECEVFATVGNDEKRSFLLKIFPQLKPENIGCSRSTAFEEMVMKQTKGRGVDVVLNSLADDKLQASVRCLAKHGRFLEIGKYDLSLDHNLGMRVFLKDIAFYGVMLDTWFSNEPGNTVFYEELKQLLNDGIRSGVVLPINRTVFQKEGVEEAFRYMGSGKHIGKVLIKIREEEEEKKISLPAPMKISASRKLYLYPNKCYIVVGGLGGFGIELAKWLVQKEAGTVILTSRYGARTPYHKLCLKRWQESGARVVVSTLDVAKKDDAEELLKEATAKYGPVGGIFNSAVVLRDAFIDNQSSTSFEVACAPKALATKYLDELTRRLCPELDMFVCFSSISCGKGNAGQTNYGYANSVMERICEQRKKDGYHGLAVQWGIIGDVGLVHRNMGEDAMIAGVMSQKIKSCLQTLEGFLLQDKPVVSSFVTADKSRMKRSDDVLSQLAHIFRVPDIDQMNPYRTFGEMGIDSMVGVELKQLLESSFDTSFSVQEIQDMKLADVKNLAETHKGKKESRSTQPKELNLSFNGHSALLPTETLIHLNKNEKGTPLFVVHGNDLCYGKLKKLFEGIECPVFALQSTKQAPLNSLQELARWYLKEIQRSSPDIPVHLASFSTAANLALEMCLQSENQNSTSPIIKSLIFINGSLELMETYTTTQQEKERNSAIYETSDLCGFLGEFSDSDLMQLRETLETFPNLEGRLNAIANLVHTTNKSAVLEALEHFTRKQSVMRFQLTSGKLQKNITAIEASENVLSNDVCSVKSFLAKICSGHVAINRLSGNSDEFLVGASSATEVANVLNKLLHDR